MVKEKHMREIEEDFQFLRDKILALLIFGSRVKKEEHEKSDYDICIVKPESREIIREVFRKIDVSRKNYDVHLFEELPLYIKMEIIKNHKVVFSKDIYGLYEYFYFYRKLWKDQERRNKMDKKDLLKILK